MPFDGDLDVILQELQANDSSRTVVQTKTLPIADVTFIPEDQLAKFSDALGASAFVSSLDLHCCRLGCVGTAVLCRKLPAQLTSLDLSFNSIGCAGCEALSHWMSTCAFQLQRLVLKGNRVQDDGAIFLSVALANGDWKKLNKLDLSENQIEDIGVEAVLSELNVCPQLEEVDFSNNAISDAAIPAFVTLIKTAPLLVSVELSNNAIRCLACQPRCNSQPSPADSTYGSQTMTLGIEHHPAAARCVVCALSSDRQYKDCVLQVSLGDPAF